MCNVYSNEKRWRAGDWALKSGGGGSEEAPLSSVTSAAAAAAVAVAATTPPQPRRATPGPARRRRRRVSTSPSCCCCCCYGRRCVSGCCRCPRCRHCPVASPRPVTGRRCRSSRYRTDDGYSPGRSRRRHHPHGHLPPCSRALGWGLPPMGRRAGN